MSGPRVLVVECDPSDPAGRLGTWLADAGADLDHRQAWVPDALPDTTEGLDGLVVLGGSMGAEDDDVYPWLVRLRALLRDAVAREVPILAVCLGAQLLAVATGGRVERNPDGPEFGAQLVAKRAVASTDPLFGPIPITPDVIQWHVDAVTALPPGAIQLASSPSCDIQAFRLGRLAWGIQFHIETTPVIVRAWAAEDAGLLEGVDVDALLARADAAHDDVAEVWQPFAAAFVEVARDPSAIRPARTLPTSTAAPITDPEQIRAALAAELAHSRGGPSPLPMPGPRPYGQPPDDD
jgi:GMP synthase (glutamine-hydrolysing)